MGESEEHTASHSAFSGQCFNSAWDLLEKPDRSIEEDEEMLRLAMASMWHWTQRPDCTQQNLAMGYWQVSRIHTVLGRADEARRYGEFCLAACGAEDEADSAPFMLAYAYEALARAESAAGNREKRDHYIAEAKSLAKSIADEESLKMLQDDLATIL